MTRDYRKWTAEEDQHVRDHWQRAEMTLVAIGAGIKRPGQAVRDRAAVHLHLGRRPVREGSSDGKLAEIARLYEGGMGPKEIGDKVGLSRSTICARLARAGVLRKANDPLVHQARSRAATVSNNARVSKPRMRLIGERQSFVEAVAPPPRAIPPAAAFDPLPGATPQPFGSNGCRWPVGGSGASMLQCGCQPVSGRPYCASHERAAMPAAQSRATTNLDKRLGIAGMTGRAAA